MVCTWPGSRPSGSMGTRRDMVGQAGGRQRRGFDDQHVLVVQLDTIRESTRIASSEETDLRERIDSTADCSSLLRSKHWLTGVARIISTAASTGIASDSPRMDRTVVNHWPSDWAPSPAGLNWTVRPPDRLEDYTDPGITGPAGPSEFLQAGILSRLSMWCKSSPAATWASSSAMRATSLSSSFSGFRKQSQAVALRELN